MKGISQISPGGRFPPGGNYVDTLRQEREQKKRQKNEGRVCVCVWDELRISDSALGGKRPWGFWGKGGMLDEAICRFQKCACVEDCTVAAEITHRLPDSAFNIQRRCPFFVLIVAKDTNMKFTIFSGCISLALAIFCCYPTITARTLSILQKGNSVPMKQ